MSMRKLSKARAGKGGGAAKKVPPPTIPGAPVLYSGHNNTSVIMKKNYLSYFFYCNYLDDFLCIVLKLYFRYSF